MSSAGVQSVAISGAVQLENSYNEVGANSKTCFTLPGTLRHHLSSVASQQSLQECLLLLVVFQEVVRRYTGQQRVVVELDEGQAAPRNIVLEGNPSLRQAAHHGQNQAERALSVPSSHSALDGRLCFRNNDETVEQSKRSADPCGIDCWVRSSAETLTGVLEFDSRKWSPVAISQFRASYQILLSNGLKDLDCPIQLLQILTPADRDSFDRWNATARDFPQARVDQLFDLRALERPEDIAVSFLNKTLTYGTLSELKNQLAGRLQNLGAQPGALVGICMDRCAETIVALLAVLQTGAAYLPLDPRFPPDRIEFMLQDARPLVVITQSHLLETLSFNTEHVVLMDMPAPECEITASVNSAIPRASHLEDVAYVLYTSGSTGRPKGVQIRHRALTNLVTAVSEDIGLRRQDILLATTTISFDISAFEIFAPLIAGAHLVVAPREVGANGTLLATAIDASGATILQATPAGWQILLEAGWQGEPGLKMLTGGEPLTWILAQRLLQRGQSLWNLYGPTEATVYATGRRINSEDATISVGRPLANYTAHVLDPFLQRLPIGAIGELFLGGVGVGAGYLNRPELNAERFVLDPFSTTAQARLYRTGDLARMLPNGEIDLLGRADNQVKVRGYRIELEEIEALLDSHPAISKSVACVLTRDEGNQSLVAYVVLRSREVGEEAAWRQHALRSLPAYMVPTSFMVVHSFLLTPNGKVDRKALPAFELPPQQQAKPDVSEGNWEQTVLRCWQRLLNRPDLGLDDDFFNAGGHSLLVMRMFAEIDRHLDRNLPISMLVEAPTARTFARMTQAVGVPTKCLVLMQPEGQLPPIFFIHHLLGDVLIYRDLANCFAPERMVFGLQPPPDLLKRSQPYSVQALAANYVGEILKLSNAGPIHVAGFSSGSILAFEMARQLRSRGIDVGLLALIDGEYQGQVSSLSPMARYMRIAMRKLCRIVFKLRDELNEGPKQFISKRVRHLRLQHRIRALENAGTPGELTMEQALLLAERAYREKPYPGSALLIRFHDEAWEFGPDPLMGWSTLVQGGISVVDLPGGHITGMSEAGAPVMVDLLRSHMQATESHSSRGPCLVPALPDRRC